MTSNNLKFAVFLGLMTVLGLAFLATAEPVLAQADPDAQDVSINWVNRPGPACHNAANRASTPYMASGHINWSVQATDNGPGSIYLEKAAFHNPTSGCAATSDSLVSQHFTMTGKTSYAQG